MIEFTISFSERETIADEPGEMAAERDITPEQLITRFICGEMRKPRDGEPSLPGEDLDDFLSAMAF